MTDTLRAATRIFRKTAHCDVSSTLTALGIGEALVAALNANGSPTPRFAERMVPPSSRTSLSPAAPRQRSAASAQEIATALDVRALRRFGAVPPTIARED